MTAVEWLVSQLNKQGFTQVVTDEEIKQAKEMEKGQICESYIYGAAYGIDINNNLLPQNYYEEKYDTK